MDDSIILDGQEVKEVVLVGCSRQWQAIKRKLKDKKGLSRDDGWTLHIEGAGAEKAACKKLNVPWPRTINKGKKADIPPDIEVRRRIEINYDLCIRDGDRPEMRYLLVVGRIPEFYVVGWIRGVDGMLPKYRKDPNGRGEAWFVPQSELLPISKLIESLHRDVSSNSRTPA